MRSLEARMTTGMSFCEASSHITNYGNYAATMGAGLADIKEWLKVFVFGKRIRNFRVMCSNSAIGLDK
jgi:hypothetical protein